jgi:hypothetical protein
MAAERLSMRKLRELLRQRLELKLSVREIARSLGIGVGTVNRYLYRAQAAKLTSWPLAAKPARARPGSRARGVQEEGRHQAPAVAGVPGDAPGGLPVQPVLRALRAVGEVRERHHAPGAPRRGEVLHGLQR